MADASPAVTPRPDDPASRLAPLRAAVGRVILGKDAVIEQLLVAVVAGGHVLIEDVPGVGKTTLAQALAQALGCSFRRVQFTSDLLPSDILGVTVFDRNASEFRFKQGPIFANVVLADEINRTTPKTQSALLEAMNTGRVHIDGHRHELPRPFHVFATQNPLEHHGTYPLPESQMDRFLMRVSMGYPDPEAERRVMHQRGSELDEVEAALDVDDLLALQRRATEVRVDPALEDYVLALVRATRDNPQLTLGVSPRGTQALVRAARAAAVIDGRDYCVPDDVKRLAVPVLAHRVLGAGGHDPLAGGRPAAELLADLVEAVPPPA